MVDFLGGQCLPLVILEPRVAQLITVNVKYSNSRHTVEILRQYDGKSGSVIALSGSIGRLKYAMA